MMKNGKNHSANIAKRKRPANARFETNGYAGTPHETTLYHGPRGAAIRLLCRIDRSDAYLDKALEKEIEYGDLSARDKSLLSELVYGVIRWQTKLDWVLTGFYKGEFVKCITPVKNAMRVALYQIMNLDRIPPSAAVNESVEVIKRIKGARSANLVNAVLRKILAHIKDIRYPDRSKDLVHYLSVFHSHPQWMVRKWVRQFGTEQTEALLAANNRKPHIALRVNALRTTVERFEEWLTHNNIDYRRSEYVRHVLTASQFAGMRHLDAYAEGWFSVQDESAALAAQLAHPLPGNLVYDVCAAPGGKTTYMAELMNDDGKIIALDKYDFKTRLIETNARRLGLRSIATEVADARVFATKDKADVALVDAPCSGAGVIAKKPDIKWKRELEDIRQLTELQKSLLLNASNLVKPGGALIYSTCSIEPEENMEIVAWFLQQCADFELEPAERFVPSTVCTDGCLQTFPHIHGTDGAFGARFRKKA